MVVVSFFILNSVFFTLNPVFILNSVFLSLTKIWEGEVFEVTMQKKLHKQIHFLYILYIFCIYSVYTYHLIMIWVEPSKALSEPHVAMCGLEIRLPIPLKRAEARFCLSRFPTFAVQKNCTGLNPAYQSAEARFCSTRLQKSWNM